MPVRRSYPFRRCQRPLCVGKLVGPRVGRQVGPIGAARDVEAGSHASEGYPPIARNVAPITAMTSAVLTSVKHKPYNLKEPAEN